MTEPMLALNFIQSILVPDSVLGNPVTGIGTRWHTPTVVGEKSPYGIVRQLTGAADLTALDDGEPTGVSIWTPVIMQVILYDRERSDYTRIDPLAQRVFELLQRQSGTLPGQGIVYGSHRTYIKASFEPDGDAVIRFIEQQFTMEVRSE